MNLDSLLISPLTGGASQINIYGAVNGSSVYRPNALTGDPNHLGIMLIVPLLVLTPMYLRLETGHRLKRKLGALIAFMLIVEIATLSRSGLLGLGVGALVLLLPYRGYLRSRALIAPIVGALAVLAIVFVSRFHFFLVVIRSRIQTGRASQSAHFQVYSFIPKILHSHPLLGLGLNNFSIYYQAVTGKTNWGPHSFYVSLIVETGLVGTVLFALFLFWVFVRLAVGRQRRDRARAGRGPARGPRAAARVGLDGGARRDAGRELLLPDDAVLLLLRVPGARPRGAARVRAAGAGPACRARGARARGRPRDLAAVRVCVVTTSYPRSPDDVAGAFVAAQVEALRAAGVEVDVVSPADFPSFGIAYGDGIVQNLRARPWLVAALLPLFLVLFARAARRASRRADVVHAHWLPSALPALATGKPLVLQVWGTDVELARRLPWLARPLLRRARVVVAASRLPRRRRAQARRALGARDPERRRCSRPRLGAPDEPPHVLYAGRLSEEKGILELLEATGGLPRVVVGDGPLRDRVPGRGRLRRRPASSAPTTSAAAVVCVPSRREGYGVVAREAMAHGRPVVATRGRRPGRRGRGRRHRARSCRRETRPRSAPRSSGCSATRALRARARHERAGVSPRRPTPGRPRPSRCSPRTPRRRGARRSSRARAGRSSSSGTSRSRAPGSSRSARSR